MKVLLVNPPCHDVYRSVSTAAGRGLPMNLAYLAAYLRENGHEPSILDANALDMDWDELKRSMGREFDAVGVGSYTPSLHLSVRVLEIAREIKPDCVTIMGGAHLSGAPVDTLERHPIIDFGVKQEGEITLAELLDALERGGDVSEIPGLVHRQGGRAVENRPRPLIEDLDSLPMPAYDLLPMERYRLPLHHISLKKIKRAPFATLFTSRGCPFGCSFCASKTVWGRRVRHHSPERVMEEIRHLRERYRVAVFEFADDTFTVNRARMNRILELIRESGLRIDFNCLSRVDSVTREDLQGLKDAGCYLVRFGVESGDPEVLASMCKEITPEQIRRAFALAREVGIAANGSVVVGTPRESRESIRRTLDLLLEIDPDIVYFFNAVPLVGTRLREEMLAKGLLVNDDWPTWDLLSRPVASTEFMSLEEVGQAQKWLYRKYYRRPGYIFKKLLGIRDPEMLFHYFKGFLAVLSLARPRGRQASRDTAGRESQTAGKDKS